MDSFKDLKNGLYKFLPGIGKLFKGIIKLIFLEAIVDFYKAFISQWKRSKTNLQKFSVFCAGIIVISFLIYSFLGMWNDFQNWRHKSWKEQVLMENYEAEIKDFFTKYNERFMAHDCAFMREVGSDEAMYDKYGTTSYTEKNYKCEEFVITQEKTLIPVKIEPILQTGDKFRVKGELLVVKRNQGQFLKIEAEYFDLWKKIDWQLWHFVGSPNGPQKIPFDKEI